MDARLTATALAVLLGCASVAHAAAPKAPTPTPTDPGGPGDDPQPAQQPDYEQDAAAGVSGANSTGVGINAVPTTPTGATGYATPGFGTLAGLGGAQQGGFAGQPTSIFSVGQVFTATGGTLNQVTFIDTNSATGGATLNIATFGANGFAGNAIFADAGAVGAGTTLATISTLTGVGDKGGVNGNDALFYHSYAGLNYALTAGQSYYLYLSPSSGSQVFNGSNSGYASRAYFFELATRTSSLGGEFVFGTTDQTGAPVYGRVANQAANTAPYLQAAYSIAITPSATAAVPEPASWAMMVAGFGLVGAGLRRRRATVRFA